MKKILPLSYPPKIEPVRTYKCRQTIREGDKKKVGDFISFFGWKGKPYQKDSTWAWQMKYMRINTVLPLKVKREGFELLEKDGRYEVDIYGFDSKYSDYLAKLDFIDPPKGTAMWNLIFDMHRLFKEREPPPYYRFQVIRWDLPIIQQKIMEG